jgi:hypothetical protein
MAIVQRLLGAVTLATLFASPLASGPADLSYLYNLADFTGKIPYNDARVTVDPFHSEVYTLYGNQIRVFNNAGMEIYKFEVDLSVGRVVDLGIESGGDILMLVYGSGVGEEGKQWSLIRADFRGRPTGEIAVERSGEAAGLLPNRLLLRSGKIWLISLDQMRAASFLPDGKIVRVLDLADLAGLTPEDRGNAEVSGVDIGGDGTVVFAVPVQFKVHSVDPKGPVRSFGKSGSAAGNFGVLGDVAVDGEGNIFVSDRLRSMVMVFTKEFRFLREGGRISNREWLARPGALALDPAGRLFVSQVRRRGVAVFAIVPAP